MSASFKKSLKNIDDRLWRMIFGPADYMQLRPPFRQRLRIALHLPFQLGKETCSDPIFIVGCPRSGTTILFRILCLSSELSSLRQESHWIWEFLHRPSGKNRYTQVLDADDLTWTSRTFIRSCYSSAFGDRRFVDKCPNNSLRITAIKAIFPRAKIVCITRSGPDTVSSLIDTWRNPRKYPGSNVPGQLDIGGYDGEKWVHSLVPGWQQYRNKSIEEVCAHQWVVVNQYLLNAKETVPAEDWIDIRYESLLTAPRKTVRILFEDLGLPVEAPVYDFVGRLDQYATNTESKPALGKWKWRNSERVRKVIPRLRPMMEQLGYSDILQEIDFQNISSIIQEPVF